MNTWKRRRIVALENIVQQLEEQKTRLQQELNTVVRMIRAAGKGVQAGIEEYDRSRKRGRLGRAVAKTKRTISAVARKKMAAAQKARWARVKAAEAKSTSSPKKTTKSHARSATKQAT
jgi:hypothetical protein